MCMDTPVRAHPLRYCEESSLPADSERRDRDVARVSNVIAADKLKRNTPSITTWQARRSILWTVRDQRRGRSPSTVKRLVLEWVNKAQSYSRRSR